MMWDLWSIAFLAAALFVTVVTTVKIVEVRYANAIALDQAISTYGGAPARYQKDSGKPRHRSRREAKGPDDNPYSARAICARVQSELAGGPTSRHSLISDEEIREMMERTDRLFTHHVGVDN